MKWGERIAAGAATFLMVLLAALAPATAAEPVAALEVSGQVLAGNNPSATTPIFASVNDASGNVYVTGNTNLNTLVVGKDATNTDVTIFGATGMGFVVKYNASGQVVWGKAFVTTSANQTPTGIAIDGASPPNVFVTGSIDQTLNGFGNSGSPITVNGPTGTATDAPYVVQIDGTGSVVWANSFGTSNVTLSPLNIAVSSDGTKVYLVGKGSGSDGGSIDYNGTTGGFLTRIGVASSSSQTRTALVPFIGDTGTTVPLASLVVTGTGDVYAVGRIFGGNLVAPVAVGLANNAGLLVGYDETLATRKQLTTYGGALTAIELRAISADSSNLYFSGWLNGNYDFTTSGGTQTITVPSGTQYGFVAKASIADQAGNPGRVLWATGIGGSSTVKVLAQSGGDPQRYNALAVDSAGGASIGLVTDGTNDLTVPALERVGTARNLVVLRLDANGSFIGGVSMGADAGFDLAKGTGISSAGMFTVAGAMTADFTVPNLPHGNNTSAGLITRAAPTYTVTAAKAGTGGGKVTSDVGGIDCGLTCTSSALTAGGTVNLTALADSGSTFTGWSGDCSGTTSPFALSLTADKSCTATFALSSGPTPPTPTPSPSTPVPPPSFVTTPPATNENNATVGSGTGSVSFAANYANPSALTFTAALPGGGSLPGWINFDPTSVTFSYSVPMPSDLPIQPLADTRAARADARATWSNTVYPLSLRVAQIPVVLTATDKATGVAYASTIQMSFYAPRSPVAISGLSMSLDRVRGDRSSGRSALSYDGGQMIFETASTNLFPAASSVYGDIVRYHGLSGVRERLSQTAIPGGGVANAANGTSSSPAVSADGAFAAFASDAASVSATPSGGRRQVYRTGLGYPRVPLNQAVTPAPEMVSATPAGIAANGSSDNPSVSQDGRYVAFDSTATNLGANPGGARHVWRKDFATSEVVQVAAGANPSISWDGRYVAFETAGQILVKDLTAGSVRTIGAGTAPRLSARGDRVVFVAATQVVQVDVATGVSRVVGIGDQPAMSADGRFVAYRAAGTNGFTQVWLRDVERGVTALVTQTATGAGGNGDSLHPSVSGDGTQVGFVSGASDLVNGSPTGTQAYLAANPLPLPEKTGYWYLASSNGGQGWLMQRWGNHAYIGSLAYDAAGQPTWYVGICQVAGLNCTGTLSRLANGAPFGAAGGTMPAATPVAAFGLATAEDGRSTALQVGNAAAQGLTMFPIAGTATTGFAGLPQAGWWYEPASNGGNGYFIAVQSQPQADGSVKQMAYVSVLTFDASGRPVWYSAQGALGADLSFSGTLLQYVGGAPLGQVQAGAAGSSPVGLVRIVFGGSDKAQISLPNGRTADIVPNRF